MHTYSDIQETVRSYFEKHPEVPEKISKREISNQRWWMKPPGLLLMDHHGQYFILTDEMHPTMWVRWMRHDMFSSICYAFHIVYFIAGPSANRNIFNIIGFEYAGSNIEGIELSCTRCGQRTYVHHVWFKSFRFHLNDLLCCHKRFVYQPYWKLLFWGASFYNALLGTLNRSRPRVWLIPHPRQQWGQARSGRKPVFRSFSSLGSTVLRNGVHVEGSPAFPRII